MARDIVCDKQVISRHAEENGWVSVYGNHTFQFCSDICKQTFDSDPDHYLQIKPADLYGCPMGDNPQDDKIVQHDPPRSDGVPLS
jgi:YHS domain-containing protein